MSRKVNRSPRKKSAPSRPLQVAFLFGMVMFLFYLWGRVEVDIVLREKGRLEQEKAQLTIIKNNLHIEINQLRSYGNIVEQVVADGMRPVPPSMKKKLVVEFKNSESVIVRPREKKQAVNYAGFRLMGTR